MVRGTGLEHRLRQDIREGREGGSYIIKVQKGIHYTNKKLPEKIIKKPICQNQPAISNINLTAKLETIKE